jgi:hypothetical protein
LLGVARDMIAGAAPPQLGSQLAEIIDSATVKLGGQPIHGRVLDTFDHNSAKRQEAQQSRGSAERGPVRATRYAVADIAGPID